MKIQTNVPLLQHRLDEMSRRAASDQRRLQTRLSEVQEALDDANRRAEAAERQFELAEATRGVLYYKGSLYKLASLLESIDVDRMMFEVEVYQR